MLVFRAQRRYASDWRKPPIGSELTQLPRRIRDTFLAWPRKHCSLCYVRCRPNCSLTGENNVKALTPSSHYMWLVTEFAKKMTPSPSMCNFIARRAPKTDFRMLCDLSTRAYSALVLAVAYIGARSRLEYKRRKHGLSNSTNRSRRRRSTDAYPRIQCRRQLLRDERRMSAIRRAHLETLTKMSAISACENGGACRCISPRSVAPSAFAG